MSEGEYRWELASWMPGKADYLQNPSPERLKAAAEAIAKVHECWFAAQQPVLAARVGPSKAMQERQQRLHWWRSCADWQHRIAEGLRRLPASKREIFSILAVRSMEILAATGSELSRGVDTLVAKPVVQHFVMRDLWSDHVLFEGDTVSGLIDFGAARIDEPAVDLARLLGSLEPESEEARMQAVEWYCSARQPSWQQSQRESFGERVQVLDRVGCMLSALQWLQWIVLQPREFRASDDFIATRWRAFLDRLS
ncbi:MAG: hypothetical protein Aurels2KO_35000 [Aureliella sp.]